MIKESLPLIEVLKQIPDNRKSQGKRHPLHSILALSVCAIVCGYKSYCSISEWGRNYGKEFCEKLGFKDGKTPCSATFHNVFKIIDVNLFEKKINEWVEGILQEDQREIAIDGKTLRGTKKQGGETFHFLSAFSHKLGITLFQSGVDRKTNEINGVKELLKSLILKGKILTMDALLTQRDIARDIKKGKGDYVMIVKDNQPTLKEYIQYTLVGEEKLGDGVKIFSSVEKGHGRIEFRQITVCSTISLINWYGSKQVFKIDREIQKKDKVSFETVYGITSLNSSPEELLTLVRGHWSIENKSHWIRDVVYDEDLSQVRNSNIAQIMSTLRNLSIGLIRLSGRISISSSCRYFSANPCEILDLIGVA